jgi:acetyltransferase-like isoleucine patch superfamily enzyme
MRLARFRRYAPAPPAATVGQASHDRHVAVTSPPSSKGPTMNALQVVGDGHVEVGKFARIGSNAQVVFRRPGRVEIGDYCSFGPGVKFVCMGGHVRIGDWTTLHDQCLVLCGRGVSIGAHCWFGQNCVIDGTGGITIGRGVRVGMYSQLWSHVAAGEQIEGCTLYGERPVVIGDDTWLVGSCIVASGVTLGRRTVALIGSNITRSWPDGSVIAGTPAASKPGLDFYKPVTLDDKWRMLQGWLDTMGEELALDIDTATPHVVVLSPRIDPMGARVAFVRECDAAQRMRRDKPALTVCCVEDKTYNKRLNATEHSVLRFLSGNKARFDAVA